MSKLLDDVIKYLESEKGKLEIEECKRRDKFEKELNQKYIEKFYYLGENKRDEILLKVKKKYESDTYKNREYGRGRFPEKYLGDIIVEYAKQFGKLIEKTLSFPSEFYLIDNKWEVGYIYGQGSEFILERI